MHMPLKQVAEFYQSNLGKNVANLIAKNISKAWFNSPGQANGLNLMGYGLCAPILERIKNEFAHKINYYPSSNISQSEISLFDNQSVIGEETRTPFLDNFFDRIICLSGLEETENPLRTLRELWRILASEGELILIVPNRRGLWSRFDNSPFGYGRPYSRTQLINLVSQSMFEVKSAKRILYAPPFDNSICNKAFDYFEKLGELGFSTFGGLIFVTLAKRTLIEPPLAKSAVNIAEPAATATLLRNLHE